MLKLLHIVPVVTGSYLEKKEKKTLLKSVKITKTHKNASVNIYLCHYMFPATESTYITTVYASLASLASCFKILVYKALFMCLSP